MWTITCRVRLIEIPYGSSGFSVLHRNPFFTNYRFVSISPKGKEHEPWVANVAHFGVPGTRNANMWLDDTRSEMKISGQQRYSSNVTDLTWAAF